MSIKYMIKKSLGFITRSAFMLAALVFGASTALAGNLTWNTTTGTWDINTTANWTGYSTKYLDGDAVTFNNAATYTVTIAAGGVSPLSTAVSAASGTITITGAALGGTGSLTKSDAGALTLSGVNTYSGGTTVSAGSLTINSVGTKSGTTITGGATGIGNMTLAGGVTLPNANGMTWYAPKVTLQGDITLEGNNRQLVGFTILDLNNGTRTIYVNPPGGGGANKQTIPGNTGLEGTGRSRWEMGNDVGNMTVQNGSLVLSSNLTGNDFAGFMFKNATSFSGNTLVTVGPNVFLQISDANSLGSTTANTPKLTVNGIWGLLGTGGASKDQTIYSLAGSGRVYASLTSGNVNSRTITINGTAGSTEFSGELSNGAGIAPLAIVKNGASTQIFSGPNTYTGSTTISGGTLILGNTKALGFGGLIAATFNGTTTVNSGYTLDLNGVTDISEPIILNGTGINGNGALVNNSGTPASIGSGIAAVQVASAGSGYSAVPAVNFSGTGSGATATASLGVTAASFGITSGGAYSTKPTAAITGGGGSGATVTLNWSGSSPNFTITGIAIASAGTGFTSVPTITLSGGVGTAAVLTANANNFTVVGVAMTAAGTGYTGTPTYAFGSGNATPGTGTLSSVALASASSIGGSGDITIGAPISGTFALTKVGAGTLTLTGNNSYSGATVSAGTLLVNGTHSGNGAVTVASLATFGGTGSNVGNVTYSSGALAKFTQGSPLTISGTLTLNNNVVHLALPTGLVAGNYTLATYTSAGSSGSFAATPVIDSGSLEAGGVATVATAGGTVTLAVTVPVVGMDHFEILGVGLSQTAGTDITGITITAKDVANVTLTGFTGTVTFGGTAGVTGTSGNFTAGVLTDVSVTPTAAGSVKTLTITSGSTTGTATFDVNPGSDNKLVFRTQPGGGTAGAAWGTQPAVTVQDAFGNTATGSTASVALTITSGTGTGALSGTATVAASSGVATFSGLSIDKSGVGYKLTATSDGLTTTNSATFNITPGSAVSLSVTGFPASQPKGQASSVTVTAKDAYGNIATNYTGTVYLTSSDGAATLPGNYTYTSANGGVYSFSGVTFNTMGTKSIIATDTVTGSITGTQSGIVITKIPETMTFTNNATWTVPGGVTSVRLLVVGGGGGGGGGSAAGGGGAGGLIHNENYAVTPGTTYTVTIGAGGIGGQNVSSAANRNGAKGGDSSFGPLVATGGGYGGSIWQVGENGGPTALMPGGSGGSGGGGGIGPWYVTAGGTASPAGQGYAGGSSVVTGGDWSYFGGGGGGGAGAAGADAVTYHAGNGGAGYAWSVTGATYAGGGGGRTYGAPGSGLTQGSGGAGGGGAAYVAGTDGLGGGGGAQAKGGSGVVIVSYTLPPQGTLVIFF